MLRKIVRQVDSSRLGRKVLTDRKNNLRGNIGRLREEEAPVVVPVVKKKVAKKTSRK